MFKPRLYVSARRSPIPRGAPPHTPATPGLPRLSRPVHQPTPLNPRPAPQNTFHPRPAPYIRDFPCIPNSKSIPPANLPATPCMSAALTQALRSRFLRAQPLHSTASLQMACTQAKPHPVRMSHLPTVRTQSPPTSSPVAESAPPLPASHSQDQSSFSVSVPFLFPAPATTECCAYTLPPRS